MPGADGRPNWCLPLPVPVEDLAAHPGVRAVAEVLAEGLRPTTSRPSGGGRDGREGKDGKGRKGGKGGNGRRKKDR
jgi:4-alpha-glucanotransferase